MRAGIGWRQLAETPAARRGYCDGGAVTSSEAWPESARGWVDEIEAGVEHARYTDPSCDEHDDRRGAEARARCRTEDRSRGYGRPRPAAGRPEQHCTVDDVVGSVARREGGMAAARLKSARASRAGREQANPASVGPPPRWRRAMRPSSRGTWAWDRGRRDTELVRSRRPWSPRHEVRLYCTIARSTASRVSPFRHLDRWTSCGALYVYTRGSADRYGRDVLSATGGDAKGRANSGAREGVVARTRDGVGGAV